MKQIAVIHLGDGNSEEIVSLLDQKVRILQFGCGGDGEKARTLIAEQDGKVDCIALDGLPATLYLGNSQRPHTVGATLPAAATKTPVVDGSGIRGGLERWAVILADRAQPGIFAEKRVLLTPGLNHSGLAQALVRHTKQCATLTRSSTSACPTFRWSAHAARWSRPPAHAGAAQGRALPPPAAPGRRAAASARPNPSSGPTSSPATSARSALCSGHDGAQDRGGGMGGARRTWTISPARRQHRGDADALARPAKRWDAGLPPSSRPCWWRCVATRSMPLSEDTYLDLMADIVWTPASATCSRKRPASTALPL
jgi:hypothetical protein